MHSITYRLMVEQEGGFLLQALNGIGVCLCLCVCEALAAGDRSFGKNSCKEKRKTMVMTTLSVQPVFIFFILFFFMLAIICKCATV